VLFEKFRVFKITLTGFTPGDKMKNIGVLGLDSSKDLANSTVRPSTYLLPNFSSINALENGKGSIYIVEDTTFYYFRA
jgi:hypothetical protein